MARIRTPIAVLHLRGSTRVHPGRYRDRMGVSTSRQGLGRPPQHLTTAAASVWVELAAAVPSGTLSRADRVLLEVLSNLLSEYRLSPNTFTAAKYRSLISCLARAGLR